MKNYFESKTPEQAFWELRSEILTSLLVIEGYTQLLQEDINSKDTDVSKVIEGKKAIDVSAGKIHKLLDDVADSFRK